ncbi:MAG TPA: hypothetical protein VGN39_03685, partial [Terriglobales bacterium]|nr:hypothetical protein [Terriglobales bacterium]
FHPPAVDAPTAALTPEQSAVYADFIESLAKMNFKYVAISTFPLDMSGIEKDVACLKGLTVDRPEKSKEVIHILNSSTVAKRAIRFVGKDDETAILKQRDIAKARGDTDMHGMKRDPGILALSEIAFDSGHRFAVLKYVFLCGTKCNSGAIVVLEKVGAHWTGTTRRPCSFEINRENPRS